MLFFKNLLIASHYSQDKIKIFTVADKTLLDVTPAYHAGVYLVSLPLVVYIPDMRTHTHTHKSKNSPCSFLSQDLCTGWSLFLGCQHIALPLPPTHSYLLLCLNPTSLRKASHTPVRTYQNMLFIILPYSVISLIIHL